MIGTWTPPGAIFTVAFDDEALTLKLVKRTEIPHDEPISWMTFDVSCSLDLSRMHAFCHGATLVLTARSAAREEKHLWSFHEEVVELRRGQPK